MLRLPLLLFSLLLAFNLVDDVAAAADFAKDERNASSSTRSNGKDVEIMLTYSDRYGAIKVRTVRSTDLSASWVWKIPGDRNHDQTRSLSAEQDPLQMKMLSTNYDEDLNKDPGDIPQTQAYPVHPVKIKRKKLRMERREKRIADLMKQDKEIDSQMQEAAIK